MKIEIMSGAGNIFAVLDNRIALKNIDAYKAIIDKIVKNINFGKNNCEGVIILNNDNLLDFDAWFLNPDGSSGMMCGNGGRCAVDFALRHNFIELGNKYIKFKMAGSIYEAEAMNNAIKLFLPPPNIFQSDINIVIDGVMIKGDYVNVGTDHFIIDYENCYGMNNYDFESTEIIDLLQKIRFDSHFTNGTNVNIYKKIEDSYLIRTFERGVEAITGACGTGTVSTALSINKNHNVSFPIKFIPPSGDWLLADIVSDHNEIINLVLIGPAIYLSNFNLENL